MVTEIPWGKKFKVFTSYFHTMHMCEQTFEFCSNSHTKNLYKKAIPQYFFHIFTSKVTDFHLENKSTMNLLAPFRLWTILTYFTLYINLSKNVDFEKLLNILYRFFKNSHSCTKI